MLLLNSNRLKSNWLFLCCCLRPPVHSQQTSVCMWSLWILRRLVNMNISIWPFSPAEAREQPVCMTVRWRAYGRAGRLDPTWINKTSVFILLNFKDFIWRGADSTDCPVTAVLSGLIQQLLPVMSQSLQTLFSVFHSQMNNTSFLFGGRGAGSVTRTTHTINAKKTSETESPRGARENTINIKYLVSDASSSPRLLLASEIWYRATRNETHDFAEKMNNNYRTVKKSVFLRTTLNFSMWCFTSTTLYWKQPHGRLWEQIYTTHINVCCSVTTSSGCSDYYSSKGGGRVGRAGRTGTGLSPSSGLVWVQKPMIVNWHHVRKITWVT